MCYVKRAEDIENKEDLQIFVTDTIHEQRNQFSFQSVKSQIMDVAKDVKIYHQEEIEDVVEGMLTDTLETFVKFKILLRSEENILMHRG